MSKASATAGPAAQSDIADRHYWVTLNDGTRTLRALPEFSEDEINVLLEESSDDSP